MKPLLGTSSQSWRRTERCDWRSTLLDWSRRSKVIKVLLELMVPPGRLDRLVQSVSLALQVHKAWLVRKVQLVKKVRLVLQENPASRDRQDLLEVLENLARQGRKVLKGLLARPERTERMLIRSS